jgi:hypothetical protein
VAIEDQIFDKVQAVDLMGNVGCETGQRSERTYRVLVSCLRELTIHVLSANALRSATPFVAVSTTTAGDECPPN